MTSLLSRMVMSLAVHSMGESRRDWALAMRVEFDVAVAEGKSFAFAIGCLEVAWREMPSHAEGRLVLANYAVALGLLIPMAVVQFALALGFSSVFAGADAFTAVPLAGATQNPVLAMSQLSAVPCLLALWLVLGLAHLRLAWVLVERDWARVTKVCAFVGATLVTLVILTGVLVLDVTFVFLQSAAIAVELWALVSLARGHARFLAHAPLDVPAR